LASELLTMTNFLSPVQDLIPIVEQRMRMQAEGHHPDLGTALDHLLSSGGKRVRPAVALLTGGMLGGDQANLITLAAAIEMLHTATLVHDDLIDGALLRRGIATLNAQWTPAATVLTGDFVFARAAKLAAETNSLAVMHLFAETLTTIVDGEITQLFSRHTLANRENYYHRIHAKTASMFELATKAAAILSDVDDCVIDQAHVFGNHIGMAFQIVDDVLDFTGEQATVGKPVASDLRQGLFTLPAIYFLENHPADPDLQTILKGGYPGNEAMERLVREIRTSGAIEKSMEEAQDYVDRSLALLDQFQESPERLALQHLASYIIRRDL
jgi:geranylgeranyl pyrophosphate synthase